MHYHLKCPFSYFIRESVCLYGSYCDTFRSEKVSNQQCIAFYGFRCVFAKCCEDEMDRSSTGDPCTGLPSSKSNICGETRDFPWKSRVMLQRRAIYLYENSSIAIGASREHCAWRKWYLFEVEAYYTTLLVSASGMANYGHRNLA